MQVTRVSLAVQVILQIVVLVVPSHTLRISPLASIYFTSPSQAFRAALPYVFASSHFSLTPVIVAKANMPLEEEWDYGKVSRIPV